MHHLPIMFQPCDFFCLIVDEPRLKGPLWSRKAATHRRGNVWQTIRCRSQRRPDFGPHEMISFRFAHLRDRPQTRPRHGDVRRCCRSRTPASRGANGRTRGLALRRCSLGGRPRERALTRSLCD